MDDHRIECPFCGKKIADGNPFCPYCGKKQPQALSKEEINKNPYQILQITKDAELEVIEAAYRSLARKYHPDSGTSSVSEERIREINWAHGILTSPDKLAEWKMKNRKKQAPKSSDKVQSPPINKTNPINEPKSPPTKSHIQSASNNPSSKSPKAPSQPLSKKNNNTPIWITIGIFVSIIVLYIFFFISVNSWSHNQSVPPTPTLRAAFIYNPTLVPTHVPTHIPSRTPTSIATNCILWSNLRQSDVNYSRCVYGRIVKIYSTEQLAQIIRFSNEAGTFLIWSQNWFFKDISINDCVAAIGYIYQNASEMYMEIGNTKLYTYDGCQ